MEETPVPEIEKFNSDLVKYGDQFGKNLVSLKIDPLVETPNELYYDPTKVYIDIATYLHDNAWLKYANAAKQHYSAWVLYRSGSKLLGYWVFTEGLARWLELNPNDLQAKAALTQLATRSAFASTATTGLKDYTRSRENAYLLLALVDTNSNNLLKLKALVDNAFGHLDQWFITKSAAFIKSFMVGLTTYSLIRTFEVYPELVQKDKLVNALKSAASDLWDICWVDANGAFRYTSKATDEGPGDPEPDLNQLIAPFYYWLWKETGDRSFLDRADTIFASGVKNAWAAGAKQFNQNHRFVFTSLKWRSEGFKKSESDEVIKLRSELETALKKISENQVRIGQLLFDVEALESKLNKIREILK